MATAGAVAWSLVDGMTGASKVILLTRLVGLFGEIEAIARRARQAAETNAKSPFSRPNALGYTVECAAIAQTIDRINDVLNDLR